MKNELTELVKYVERIRHAFYVLGKPAAVKEAMASGHEAFKAARDTIALPDTAPSLLTALKSLAECGTEDHDEDYSRTCDIDNPQGCALCAARAAIIQAEGE